MPRLRDDLLHFIAGQLDALDEGLPGSKERQAFLEQAREHLHEGLMSAAVMAAVVEFKGGVR